MKHTKLLIAALCCFLFVFIQGCGSSSSSGTTASTTAVTISGSMSLDSTGSSSSIINSALNLDGVLSMAQTPDAYKLYCVTFTTPPSSCDIGIAASGVINETSCTDFGSKGFGCFVVNVADTSKVTPLVVTEGTLAATAGTKLVFTVVYDSDLDAATVLVSIAAGTGSAVAVSEEDLLDLSILDAGVTFDITPKQQGTLGIPTGSTALDSRAEEGPIPGTGPGPVGGVPETMWMKRFVGADLIQRLLIADGAITDAQCHFDAITSSFIWKISNGTQSQTIRIDNRSNFESDIGAVLDTANGIISSGLASAITGSLNALIGDRFAHCDALQNKFSTLITANNCKFGHVDRSLFQNIDPSAGFDVFSTLTLDKITEPSGGSTHTVPAWDPSANNGLGGQSSTAFEPAIEITGTGPGGGTFTFREPMQLWCPDPFRPNGVTSYPIHLTSSTTTVDKAAAIAQVAGDQTGFLNREGCSTAEREAETRREFVRALAELFEFASRFDAQQCNSFLRSEDITRMVSFCQQSVGNFDPNFGGGSGTSGGFDPAMLDIVKDTNGVPQVSNCTTANMEKYMLRFMPIAYSLMCSASFRSDTTLQTELKTMVSNSCMPRGVRVEHQCEEDTTRTSVEGDDRGFTGVICKPTLIKGKDKPGPTIAHDFMTRDMTVASPFFAAESIEGPFTHHFDDGSGVPQTCKESFGVRMIAQDLLDGTYEVDVRFNDKSTCRDKQAQGGGDDFQQPNQDAAGSAQDANSGFTFIATPRT